MCRKPPKPYYNKVVLSLLKLQHTQDRVPSKQAVFCIRKTFVSKDVRAADEQDAKNKEKEEQNDE